MSCKVGNRNHKEGCLRYKQEGRREKNKQLRAERNERRIAKFARRRENKQERNYKSINPDNRGTNLEPPIGDFAYRPKMKNMTEFQRVKSFERRIQNQLDAEIMAIKKAEQQKNSKNNKEGKD